MAYEGRRGADWNLPLALVRFDQNNIDLDLGCEDWAYPWNIQAEELGSSSARDLDSSNGYKPCPLM